MAVLALVACGLTAKAQSTVTLAWNASPSPSVTGYHLYYGAASQNYTNVRSLGNVTNATISSLVQGSTYYFTVTATDSTGLESPHSNEVSYTVPTNTQTNTPPLISSIPNQTVTVGSSTPALPFSVQDAQTPATSLMVTANSSNPTLVPASGIFLGGSGTNRTVTITPVAGQTGTTTIALTVCDPSLCTTTTFGVSVVPVNPSPTITLSAPANGASFTAPATITLTASVTANGHTITGVQFYNGSALLGQAVTAPYAYSWNNVAAGSYTLSARAIYDSGSTVTSASSAVTVQQAPGGQPLPLPWQTADIGSVGVSGAATASNGVFTVDGAGSLGSAADSFRFVYQSLSGDGQIACQITSVEKTGGSGLAGVMIRENLTSGSRYAFMGLNGNGQFRALRRTATSGSTASNKSGQTSFPNAWVRLVRTGNTLSSYKSSDGTNWTLVNSVTVTMAADISVGLAVASGSSGVLNTSVFANVTVVP
jgi:Bacterial Ig domain/Fibronectin type III domain